MSLDDLQEQGGPVLHGLGEDLQQVAVVVKVHQNTQPLQFVHVLLHRDLGCLQPLPQLVIVCLGDAQELSTPSLQVSDLEAVT